MCRTRRYRHSTLLVVVYSTRHMIHAYINMSIQHNCTVTCSNCKAAISFCIATTTIIRCTVVAVLITIIIITIIIVRKCIARPPSISLLEEDKDKSPPAKNTASQPVTPTMGERDGTSGHCAGQPHQYNQTVSLPSVQSDGSDTEKDGIKQKNNNAILRWRGNK